jgi:hypothetical protein
MRYRLVWWVAIVALGAFSAVNAHAEVSEVRISRGFGVLICR